MAELGSFIKMLREEKGMSITELARKTKMSRPYLSQIESGKRKPSNDLLYNLSVVLGVSYSIMLEKARQHELSKGVMYAQAEYDDLINKIEELQGDGTINEFIKALRIAFDYDYFEIAEETDLMMTTIKGLETDEYEVYLSKENLYKLSKAYDKKLSNVFYALLERAGYVEYPGMNNIDILQDNTGTIDSMQKVQELIVNGKWNRDVLVSELIGHEEKGYHLDHILRGDMDIFYNQIKMSVKELNLLDDFIDLLIKHRNNN